MIIVEEKHDKKAKWQGHKDPLDIQGPKVNEPVPWLSRVEGLHNRDQRYMSLLQVSRNVGEPGPEESCELSNVCVKVSV